jgi:hypothetical protein
MSPIIKSPWTSEERARQGIRGIDDCRAEALVRLQQKLEGWIHQRGPQAGTPRRRRPIIMNPRASAPG